jgi:hypothetical protein
MEIPPALRSIEEIPQNWHVFGIFHCVLSAALSYESGTAKVMAKPADRG